MDVSFDILGKMPLSHSQKGSPQKSRPFLKTLTLFLFFLGIALCVIHKLWAYDIWWHLKTGEWILTHHTVPRTDLYSYAVSDHPWIDLSWGFQLLVYIFYRLLGVSGIILLKVSVITFTFFLLFRCFDRKVPLLFLLPILSLCLFTAHERLVERPEVFSYLFLVLTLFLLEKNRQRPTKLLYTLPFLQVLWVNTHGLFVLGILALATHFLGDLLERRSSLRRSARILLLSCLATVMNPYGLKGALLPFTLFTRISGQMDVFTRGIGEFSRPLAGYDPSLTVLFYKTLLLLACVSFLLNHRRFSFSDGFLFLAFASLSLLARRNIAPFAFVSCFLILKNLGGLVLEKPHLLKMAKSSPALLLAFALLPPLPFITNAFYQRERLDKRFGFGISEHRYCIEAANFIEKIDPKGNFFNSGLETGNYLLWRFYPQRKVFMDARLEVYGESFFQELFQLFNAPSLWPRWVERYRINFCILDHTNQKHESLLRWLYQSPDWSPIYLDDQVIFFLKKAPENREILQAYSIDLVRDPIPSGPGDSIMDLRLADFYARVGIFEKAEILYRKNLKEFPSNATLYYNLGNVLREQGKISEALSSYSRAIAMRSKDPLFHYGLGDLYVSLGKDDLALGEFKESTKLSPHLGESHYNLGRLYEKRKQIKEAEKAYGNVGVSNSKYLDARNALGVLYAERGEFEKAEKEFREILRMNPTAGGTWHNLKKLETLKKENPAQK